MARGQQPLVGLQLHPHPLALAAAEGVVAGRCHCQPGEEAAVTAHQD